MSLRTEFCKHGGAKRYDAMGQMTQTAAIPEDRAARRPDGVRSSLVVLALVRLAVSAIVGGFGVVALSDDDYARVTIAQRFAAEPKVDPSGTSWLPFPFWITGAVMKVFDSSLEVARATSAGLAIGATWLLFAAARVWGLGERQALLAAAAATFLPAAAILGAVTVPELPTAALSAFAIAAASSRDGVDRRLSASLTIGAATLSRYEAWPVALVVALLIWARGTGPMPKRVGWALVPLAGPVAWMVHNQWAHGDALSFFRRVSNYRAALAGGAAVDRTATLIGLLVGSPAVLIALAIVVFGSRRSVRRLAPLGAGALALVVFLAFGDAIGGAPTHHPERTLLLVWLLGVLAIVDLASVRRLAWWMAAPVVLALAIDYRVALSDRGADRHSEESTGTQLRSLASRGERVYVATQDYGYFAVEAAFGRPLDTLVDKTHDPRIKTERSLLDERWEAPERLRVLGASWLVAPATVVFPISFRERSRDGHLAIYEVPR